MKAEYEKAKNYLTKSLNICEEKNERHILPKTLYYLICLSIELKNLDQAEIYLNRLEEISIETGHDRIKNIYSFSKILILKASGNISDLVKATEMLVASLADKDLPSELRLERLYALLEIRIIELQFSATKETLSETKKQAIRLEVESEEQKLQWLLANVYRLQSQLALIELDAQKAIELLQKAQTIAEEINVELLKKEIRIDQEKIEKQMGMWNKLQEQKAPISETVKFVSLESTAKNIKQETVLEERDEETGKIIEYRKLFALKI
jgi:hypothetical protein